jgi:Zn-dependent protease with chaperone function
MIGRPCAVRFTYRLIALSLAVLLCVPASAVSPSTPQLPVPPKVSMSRDQQRKLGLRAAAEVYKQMPVLPDSSPITQYVQRLGKKLVKQIPQQYSWPYEFHVVQQKEINAFALPGGPMFVNVGTITAAQNEAQLAGVMAHEMSHVYMQHSAKQAGNMLPGIISALGQIAGAVVGGAGGAIANAGGQLGGGLISMRYSRGDEAQADAVGAIIVYKAGYNPMELARFFEILNKQGGSPPQFLSDHPNPGNRSDAIAKEIRDWPKKQYVTESQEFQDARNRAQGVKAYTAQEISDGAKRGVWARENMQSGSVPESAKETVAAEANAANVSDVKFEQVKPSDTFTETRQGGLEISYPANWTSIAGQNSLTIAPKAGVGLNAIAYGVLVSTAQDSKSGSLDQFTQNLIQNLQQSNPGMRQSGDIRSTQINDVSGREVDLTSSSPIQQNGSALPERDRLIVRPAGEGYLYLIFIAPERDFEALSPTFRKILESVRVLG